MAAQSQCGARVSVREANSSSLCRWWRLFRSSVGIRRRASVARVASEPLTGSIGDSRWRACKLPMSLRSRSNALAVERREPGHGRPNAEGEAVRRPMLLYERLLTPAEGRAPVRLEPFDSIFSSCRDLCLSACVTIWRRLRPPQRPRVGEQTFGPPRRVEPRYRRAHDARDG